MRISNTDAVGLACLGLLLAGCAEQEPKVAGLWYAQSQVELCSKVNSENCASCHNDVARGTLNWRGVLPDGSYPPPPLNGTAQAWHHPLKILEKVIS